jgi:DNA-binding transcriptional ArsR family regulator
VSHQATKWARVQNLHKTPKAVLLNLADRADPRTDYCFPGQKTIASDTGLSERTVRRALTYLEECGYIKRWERRRRDGYRSSDGIEILVCDDELSHCTYSEWCTEQA